MLPGAKRTGDKTKKEYHWGNPGIHPPPKFDAYDLETEPFLEKGEVLVDGGSFLGGAQPLESIRTLLVLEEEGLMLRG